MKYQSADERLSAEREVRQQLNEQRQTEMQRLRAQLRALAQATLDALDCVRPPTSNTFHDHAEAVAWYAFVASARKARLLAEAALAGEDEG